jgi:hypothetical protein
VKVLEQVLCVHLFSKSLKVIEKYLIPHAEGLICAYLGLKYESN